MQRNVPFSVGISVVGAFKAIAGRSDAFPRMSPNIIDVNFGSSSFVGIHGKSKWIAQPIAVNFLTFDGGLGCPTISIASLGLFLHVWIVIGYIAVGSQAQNLAEQHIQRLRIQNAVIICGGYSTSAIAHTNVEMSICAESNLTRIVAAIGHNGRIKEYLLGILVDLEILPEHEAGQPIDRTSSWTSRRIAVVILVQRPIQIDVPIAILAKVGMERTSTQPTFDVGANFLEFQRLGDGGIVAFVILDNVQRTVLVGDHHELTAVGRDLHIRGIINFHDEVLIKITAKIRIDGKLGMVGACGMNEEGDCCEE